MMTAAAPDISKLRFLVVEDQGFQRWVVGHLLESLGAQTVFSAADGQEALEIYESVQPPIDVIVSDLNMPGMDGMEFIRHVGEFGLPVAFIVASEQDRAILASVTAMLGAYGVQLLDAIPKPVTARKLTDALAHYQPPRRDAREIAGPALPLDEILDGIARGEFEPFFQAKIDVATGAFRGAEALARWRHPVHGTLGPQSFVRTLEGHSRLEGLTLCVLRKAAEACRAWRAQGFDAPVAVNVSRTSLADVHLADTLLSTVASAELDPKDFVLELTETAAGADLGRVLENLSRLRMKGFGLSIDDYGTGYSSMQQLTRIPFTELKIDQSFVRNAAASHTSRAMLESSLEVAAKLRIVATAEGVETRQEMQLLRDLGCPLAQGFFVCRPLAVHDFMRWLLEHHGRSAQRA